MDERKKSSGVFCVRGIEVWRENEAPHAGPFVLPEGGSTAGSALGALGTIRGEARERMEDDM
jgi:hypothetical protein